MGTIINSDSILLWLNAITPSLIDWLIYVAWMNLFSAASPSALTIGYARHTIKDWARPKATILYYLSVFDTFPVLDKMYKLTRSLRFSSRWPAMMGTAILTELFRLCMDLELSSSFWLSLLKASMEPNSALFWLVFYTDPLNYELLFSSSIWTTRLISTLSDDADFSFSSWSLLSSNYKT